MSMRIDIQALHTYMLCPAKYVYQYQDRGKRVKGNPVSVYSYRLKDCIIYWHTQRMRKDSTWAKIVEMWEDFWGEERNSLTEDRWSNLLARGLSVLRRLFDLQNKLVTNFTNYPYEIEIGVLESKE